MTIEREIKPMVETLEGIERELHDVKTSLAYTCGIRTEVIDGFFKQDYLNKLLLVNVATLKRLSRLNLGTNIMIFICLMAIIYKLYF